MEACLKNEDNKKMIAKGTLRGRKAFDIGCVTTRFYERFQQEYAIFIDFIQGISAQIDREWYGSLMLNRLMFIYFIQKKGFLDGNVNYLLDKLRMMQEKQGKDVFLPFYRYFLLRLFQEPLPMQKQVGASEMEELLGDIPYLNGGLLEVHELEHDNENIWIADEAFERIFTFFDSYQWQMNEQPL